MLRSKAENVLQFAVHSYILMTKEAIHLATRTANVMARVEPDVKEQAENIMARASIERLKGLIADDKFASIIDEELGEV